VAAVAPLDERVRIAGQLAVRSRIFFDIWWFYKGAGTRGKIIYMMNEYFEFFRFDAYAHFVAFVIHIAALFEDRRDTVNLPALIREAKDTITSWAARMVLAEYLLTHARPLVQNVTILRSNLFAHRSTSLSYKACIPESVSDPR
jgi:hypothetical protein